MNVMRLCVAVAAVALLAGCPKREGPPSPAFEKARDRFFALEATDPTGVFSNPELKKLLPDIDGVPADSVEKAAAVDLSKTIHDGIADAEKTAADRAKTAAQLSKPPAAGTPSNYVATPTAPPTPVNAAPSAAPAPAVDGGTPAEAAPGPGTSVSDLTAHFGACFSKTGAYTDDKGATGETYAMGSDSSCARRFPAQANVILLAQGGKVTNIVPKSAVTSSSSFSIGNSTTPAPAPAPAPPPNALVPVAPAAPIAAAPVLPTTASDQITTPPADPNVNPDAINK